MKKKEKEQQKNTNFANDRNYILWKKEEQLLDPQAKLCRQISYQLGFKKRTFKT